MALIELTNVDLEYPLRENVGISLKEYLLHGLFRRKNQLRRLIRALKGVSLRIEQGERVGIVGHNGAGKSTLLRTIAGVYPIARGERVVEGSMCSLFDIALGFEADANGWKNIRYRAYLQGETPTTLQSKLQEIASFSELGDFLDLPLRTYSTGMLMRLAFSIATSSDPDILLVDEVFNTGDIGFQKKANRRLKSMIDRANILVMVGHDVDGLATFCQRVVWMHQAQVHRDGPAKAVLDEYYEFMTGRKRAAA